MSYIGIIQVYHQAIINSLIGVFPDNEEPQKKILKILVIFTEMTLIFAVC